MPRQDIRRQIYRIPTYMESYTPTRLDIKSSLINLIKSLFYLIASFHLLLSATMCLLSMTVWIQSPISTEELLQNAHRQESGGKSRSSRESLLRTWRKPNRCTVQIRTLGAPGIRPDARRVSKNRLLSQTLAYPEVATRHIIALAQDCSRGLHSRVDAWYIGHSAHHTPTKISSHSN
jgi:hypothetical protein